MKQFFGILLCLCLLLSMAACARETEQEQAPEEEKKITVYVVTEQKNYSPTGELGSTATFQYDDYGRPTVIELQYANGRTQRAELTYDKQGNLIREAFTQIVGDHESSSVDSYALSYTDGRLTHCDLIDKYGEIAAGMDLHYDRKGNLVLVEYDEDYRNNLMLCWHSFEYNDEGQLTRETQCAQYPTQSIDGIKGYQYSVHRVDYSYDDSGNLSYYSFSTAKPDTLVAHDRTDGLEFKPGSDQYAFATDKDGHLYCTGREPDPDLVSGQFSIFDMIGAENLDEHGNLVKWGSNTEYSYQAIELTESDARIAKRMMHGISATMNSYVVYACMDPIFLECSPIILYAPFLKFQFYYLIPYPQFALTI